LKRDFEDAVFAPSGVLSNERVENLSSIGFIGRLNELERVVGANWPWFGQYGDELLEELKKLNIPPMQPKSPKKRVEKRHLDLEEECLYQDQHVTKKKRGQKQIVPTQNPTRTPIAVAVNPAPPSNSAIALQHVTYSTTPPALPLAIPNSYYATQQYYATPQGPQLHNNPYAFMQYPYTVPPAPPFYGYFQTPVRPGVPYTSSRNGAFPQVQIKLNIEFFHSKFCILQYYTKQFQM
jgi:hypothetical protein